MARTVVWVEGVDFDETLLDTNKLSIIRGACRTLEEMPPLVRGALEQAFPGQVTPVALGGSKAGFVVEAVAQTVERALAEVFERLARQGHNPADVKRELAKLNPAGRERRQGHDPVAVERELEPVAPEPLIGEPALAVLARAAPFAHLIFHHAIRGALDAYRAASDEPVDVACAVEAARAAVRVKQLHEPGKRACYQKLENHDQKLTTHDRPCEFDNIRPAEYVVEGPPKADGSTTYRTSRASVSRWYFGRAERQRLYETARVKLLERAGGSAAAAKFAFVDDLQEMIAEPRPSVPDPRDPDSTIGLPLPVSLKTKIAVFVADGDKFGETIKSLKGDSDSDAVKGQSVFTISIDKYLRELVETLVLELAEMRDAGTETVRAQESLAAALPKDSSHRHKGDRRHLSSGDLLLRFETLLFGGDDLTFVVPAWLGWWLAKRFFSVSREWKISANDGKDEHPIGFSAGMVFAPAKSPIRSLKQLAGSLCETAKGVGGLEVEVIESLEPPAGGIDGLRNRLLGKASRGNPGWRDDAGNSRLAIRRDDIDKTLSELAGCWTGAEALPASQLHRALRAARRCGELASPAAATAAGKELQLYAENAGRSRGFTLDRITCLPNAAGDFAALKLHFLLQQRDYVIAGWPFANRKDSQ